MKIVYGTVIVDGQKVRKGIVLEDRSCKECGKAYEPKRQSSEYCSRECGKSADRKRHADKNRQRASEWYTKNIEKVREKRKAIYWSNPDKARQATKAWRDKNLIKAKTAERLVKDKKLHGGKREQIIKEQGGRCFMCDKDTLIGWRDSCVHHVTFDSSDHSKQVLVCRSCHLKIHKKQDIVA